MIDNCKDNLNTLKALINELGDKEYTFSSKLLTNASIGEHMRHILEFYLCLFEGTSNQIVNYDARKRDHQLEVDRKYALFTIDKIFSNISRLSIHSDLFLEGDFGTNGGDVKKLKTSFNRELAYCLEHSIHHQALIKIALVEQNLEALIHGDFGVAPATLRYRLELCAQ